MNINKKYAIRKLAVGVASVSIGLFVANSINSEVAQTLGSVGGKRVIQAFDNGTENASNETTKQWKPEGNIVARGEDGVPWELYENGYLLFKPEVGKDTLSNTKTLSWKDNHGTEIKAIGFSDKIYAPKNSMYLFSKFNGNLKAFSLIRDEVLPELEYIETNKIDTSKVTNMSSMFAGLTELTTLDLSNWDTSNVTDMNFMFSGTRKLKVLNIENWKTGNVEEMNSMFADAKSLKNLNLNHWNTSKVTTMIAMFKGTTGLTNLEISNWNTSNVLDMSQMFEEATGLTTLDINNWNTSKVRAMSSMFRRAKGLTTLNLNNWDTRSLMNINNMFEEATGLTNLEINNWNTSRLNTMYELFKGAKSLTILDLSKWNIRHVENIGSVFEEATGLISLDISGWDTKNITYMSSMFEKAYALKEIKIGNKLKTSLNSRDNMFEYLNIHFYGKEYSGRWMKKDGSAGPFSIEEWRDAYNSDPNGMSGIWIREKNTTYTLNFDSGTTEAIDSIEATQDTPTVLPIPTIDKKGYKFLGWAINEESEVITNTVNIANVGDNITLYAKWEKVNDVIKEKKSIEITTIYKSDNTLDKGQRNEEEGQVGEKEIITTYKVTPITGELTDPTTTENVITEMVPKVIKIGTKPTEVEKRIELPITEKQTDSLVRGKERITQGSPRIEKEITEYTVNETTGDITESKCIEVENEGTPTVKEIGTREVVNKIINEQGKELTPEELINYTEPNYGNPDGTTEEGDPIYNVRRIITTYKSDDILDKGKQVVEKDGKLDGNKIVKVGTKPTVEVEKIPFSVRYEKDNSREKGQENIPVQGKDGSKTITTTYTVNSETGEVEAHLQEPVVVKPTETIIKVAAKDKVEIVNKKDGSVVKEITIYTVNEKTGEITERKREEVIKNNTETSKGTENPPVVENKDFVEGVNPNDAPVVEELPELKVVIIKDNKGSILEVIKEDEKPKEINGYKNTGKVEVDKDGYKVYIYEKVETQKTTTEEKPIDSSNKEENKKEVVSNKKEDNLKENNGKETIKKQEELPKTSSSVLSTVGLLSIFGLRKNRKKDK